MPRDFDAFISYSHSADNRLAPRIEAGLQRFAKPWYKLRQLRVFRDGANLNLSAHLWESIRSSLERSAHFVYLASPAAAQSPWVGREVAYWLEHRERDTLIIVVTDGDIAWDEAAGDFDWTRTNCLPRAFSGAFGGEPFFLDMRWARAAEADLTLRNARFTGDVALLSATLHGKAVEDMMGEELAQHRRTTLWRNGAIAALGTLLVAALLAAWQARQRGLEAERQRGVADERRVEAERQRAAAQVAQRRAEDKQREADEQRAEAEAQRTLADERRIEAENQRRRAEQERDRAEAGAILTRVNAELQAGSVGAAASIAMQGAARYPEQPSVREAVRTVGFHPSAQLLALRNVAPAIDGLELSADGSRILVVSGGQSLLREARLFDAQGRMLNVVEGVGRARLLDSARLLQFRRIGTPVAFAMPDGSMCATHEGIERVVPAEPRPGPSPGRPRVAGDAEGFMHVGFQSISADARRSVALCGRWLLVNEADGPARAAASDGAQAARLSPDGQWIALQGTDRVTLIEASALPIGAPESRGPPAQPAGLALAGTAPVFAPDSRRVATVSGTETTVWDLQGRPLMRRPGVDPQPGPGDLWVTRSGDGSLLWRGAAAEPVRLAGVGAHVSADGRWITTSSADGFVHVWTGSGAPVARLPGRIGRVSPLGPSVVTAGAAGVIQVWDLRRVGLLSVEAAAALWPEPGAAVETKALADLARRPARGQAPPAAGTGGDPCAEPVARCAPDRSMRVLALFSAVSGRQVYSIELRFERLRRTESGAWQTQPIPTPGRLRCEGPGTDVQFSPRPGGPLAIGCYDGRVQVFDREARAVAQSTSPAPISALAWSADGTWLAVGRNDGVLELQDASTGQVRHTLPGHESPLVAAQAGPHPGLVLTLTRSGIVRLWSIDARSGPRLLESTHNEGDRLVAARLSADGRWLLAAAESGSLHRRAVADAAMLADQYPWLAAPRRP